MRNTILTLAMVLLTATLSAQGVFSNNTQSILEKVIRDYPNHFYNIKGELIGQALETTRYKSTIQLPGSSSSTITLYSASQNEGSGWTCNVLEDGNFNQAKMKFAEIYGQLSNSIITTGGQKTFILSGQYEEPVEEKKCTRVLFSLLPGMGDMKKLKVELCLKEEAKGWTVSVTVQDLDPKEESAVAMATP